MALREGLLLASTHLWKNVILESDAINVVNSINPSSQSADDDPIVSSIRLLGSKFSSFQTQYCRRKANGVTHLLASKGLFVLFLLMFVILGLLPML